MFSSGVSVVSRLEKSLSPITRATVVIFAELNLVPRVLSYPPYERERAGRREPWERGCAVLGCSLFYLLSSFDGFLLGDLASETKRRYLCFKRYGEG